MADSEQGATDSVSDGQWHRAPYSFLLDLLVSMDCGRVIFCHVNREGAEGMVGQESQQITVTVKLFAAYQEAYGVPELGMKVPTGTAVEQVLDRLLAEHPELEQWRDLTRFGINFQFVEVGTTLQDGDEVVLIPPVSGG